jgi:hypothetical protein
MQATAMLPATAMLMCKNLVMGLTPPYPSDPLYLAGKLTA